MPFDGSRLLPDSLNITAEGVRVMPPIAIRGGLLAEDRVIAIEGVGMEQYASRLFTLDALRPSPLSAPTDNIRHYTVLRDGQEVEVSVQMTSYPLGRILRNNWGWIVLGVAFLLVAGFVLWQRPDLLSARLLFLTSAGIFSASVPWSLGFQASDYFDGRLWWLFTATTVIAYLLYWIASLHFALIFPRPLPIVANSRRAYLLYPIVYLLFLLVLAWNRKQAVNTLDWLGSWEWFLGLFPFILLVLTVLTVFWQYRTSQDETTRQQIRWVVLATLGSGILTLLAYLLPPLVGGRAGSSNFIALIILSLPLALAAAILRYRLFDIDVLIRRTLVYSILTAVLAAVYFTSVVLLQFLFTDFVRVGSSVAIVISTLLIAALFTPLRRQVQNAIDRRFYRQRYNAQQVLANFAAAVRSETDPDRLTAELLRVVGDTMRPAHITLCLVRVTSNSQEAVDSRRAKTPMV